MRPLGNNRYNAVEPLRVQLHRRRSQAAWKVTRFIYFIRAISGGPVKIGIATNPWKRLDALQDGSPEVLEILHYFHGAELADEKSLHARFAHLNYRGEWFHPAPELLAYIESLKPQPSTPGA